MAEDMTTTSPSKAPEKPQDAPEPIPGAPAPSADRVKDFHDLYTKLWDEDPPPGEPEHAAASMNLVQYEMHLRADPSFSHSPTYEKEAQKIVEKLKGWHRGG